MYVGDGLNIPGSSFLRAKFVPKGRNVTYLEDPGIVIAYYC